ncbi:MULTISPECIES: hypothetical protein [Bradyrhizobium]|uniref:hypothetical protein n=1 Tax=Bradyrhizobium TaxID=374 RepID=UPI000307A124|nr:hypothetical protein [Bradyrhizobium japonicum]KMJ95066.1 hypothetical protein CF64_34225 [Bradyrhizobium japonicum]MCS3986840.1 hypothetical protein [Bradyrhizobium japonicum]MCS4018342.1 hypothetical protein [Bradyrhizobium japonicum]MDH6178746.1 hypothetical protein [Bradyrhizobium japonicum]
MSVPIPDWVSFDAVQTAGLDLLGLRAPVQAIGNDLFDGVTTVTPKLRYMSLISWMIWRYAQARLPEKRSSFVEFAAAQEAAFVMANRMIRRDVNNLVGVEAADEALDSGKKTLPLRKLTQNIALNAYIASSRQLKLTGQAAHGLNKLSEERGAVLAKEFDKVLHDTVYGARLAKKPSTDRISRGELEELAEPMSIVSIPRGEREVLIDVLMPRNPTDAAERRRLRHYTLMLWLTEANERPIEEADIFEAAQQPPEGLPACLESSTDGFLAYVARDCLAICHEYVFAAVMRAVDAVWRARSAPALSSEVVASLSAAAPEKDEALGHFRILGKGETAEGLSFRTVYERVQEYCRKGRVEAGGVARWAGGLSETALYKHAQSSGDAAVALLPVAWCLASARAPLEDAAVARRSVLLDSGGPFQIGINAVIRPKIDEFLEDDRSYRDVMAELVMRTVQQHLRVAWKRFSVPRGKDVSVLIADTEAWSRNNGFNPGRTGSRLPMAIDWLKQLDLTDKRGLTKSGARMLKRSLDTLGRP